MMLCLKNYILNMKVGHGAILMVVCFGFWIMGILLGIVVS